jgi:hypothetical protein
MITVARQSYNEHIKQENASPSLLLPRLSTSTSRYWDQTSQDARHDRVQALLGGPPSYPFLAKSPNCRVVRCRTDFRFDDLVRDQIFRVGLFSSVDDVFRKI